MERPGWMDGRATGLSRFFLRGSHGSHPLKRKKHFRLLQAIGSPYWQSVWRRRAGDARRSRRVQRCVRGANPHWRASCSGF